MNPVTILACLIICSSMAPAEDVVTLASLIGRWDEGRAGVGVEPFFAITRVTRRVDGIWAETAALVELEGGETAPVTIQFTRSPEDGRAYARVSALEGAGTTYTIVRAGERGFGLERISETGPAQRVDLRFEQEGQLVVIIQEGEGPKTMTEVARHTYESGSLRVKAGSLSFVIDRSWELLEPRTAAVLAGLALPAAEDEGLGASLLIFYFGQDGAGSASDNLDRWISQMKQPLEEQGERDSTAADASQRKLEVSGMRVDALEISGTYHERDLQPTPCVTMWAAIVQAPDGPCYFKVLGPASEISRWRADLELLLSSLAPVAR